MNDPAGKDHATHTEKIAEAMAFGANGSLGSFAGLRQRQQ
jgi:hypothetical protein